MQDSTMYTIEKYHRFPQMLFTLPCKAQVDCTLLHFRASKVTYFFVFAEALSFETMP